MPTAASVAKFLKTNGIEVLSFQEGDEMVDGEVCLPNNLAVQVGDGLSLGYYDEAKEELCYIVMCGKKQDILAALKSKATGKQFVAQQ